MAKFIKKVLMFFALIAVVDIACGFGFDYLRSHAKGGDTQKNYYISEHCCDDVLILGSSRAARHYDPQVLEDSLGLSCYNCGEPGCGIITAYARYGMIEPRHKPKLVVYEVSPNFDYFKTDDYSKYLGKIKQYADIPTVRKLFIELGDELEELRLLSNMYKNNSCIVHNAMDNLVVSNESQGFKPLRGSLKKIEEPRRTPDKSRKIDTKKFSYMNQLVEQLQAENVPICFMASPQYIDEAAAAQLDWDYEPLVGFCQQFQVPFINHLYMEGISDNPELFHDLKHLNNKGAAAYTKAVCEELKGFVIN